MAEYVKLEDLREIFGVGKDCSHCYSCKRDCEVQAMTYTGICRNIAALDVYTDEDIMTEEFSYGSQADTVYQGFGRTGRNGRDSLHKV